MNDEEHLLVLHVDVFIFHQIHFFCHLNLTRYLCWNYFHILLFVWFSLWFFYQNHFFTTWTWLVLFGIRIIICVILLCAFFSLLILFFKILIYFISFGNLLFIGCFFGLFGLSYFYKGVLSPGGKTNWSIFVDWQQYLWVIQVLINHLFFQDKCQFNYVDALPWLVANWWIVYR